MIQFRHLARLAALCLAPHIALADTGPADRAVAAHYPPLMVEGDADRPGYAVEVLQEAARRAGRDVDVQFLPFERAIHTVLEGDQVLMPALFQGKERDSDILWLAEVKRTALRFSSIATPVNTPDQARALPLIVAERGTTSAYFLGQLGFTNLQETSSPFASANMLASGRAQAWLLTEQLMRQTWQSMNHEADLIVGDVIHDLPVFMVASLRLPDEVRIAYQAAVAEMRADGTLRRIATRYADSGS